MQQNEVNSEKHVTNRNGVQLARKARENGVSREDFQKFLNNPEDVKKFFNEIKYGYNWFRKLQIEANKIGARVHLIELKVDYTKSHKEAAMACESQTDLVLEVADLYQPIENKITDEVIILFNWINDKGSYSEACAWGKQNGLLQTTPHVPFAISEQFPKLNIDLGTNPMYLVETTGCSYGNTSGNVSACNVRWDNNKRKANLYYLSSFNYNFVWLAFRKKHI